MKRHWLYECELDDTIPDYSKSPEVLCVIKEKQDWIVEWLNTLPRRQYNPIVLHYLLHYTVNDIANMYNVPTKRIRHNINQALSKRRYYNRKNQITIRSML